MKKSKLTTLKEINNAIDDFEAVHENNPTDKNIKIALASLKTIQYIYKTLLCRILHDDRIVLRSIKAHFNADNR